MAARGPIGRPMFLEKPGDELLEELGIVVAAEEAASYSCVDHVIANPGLQNVTLGAIISKA